MGKEQTNKLWTKDFTIITVGSMVSIFGNVLSGFAMSLMVLDYTGSTLYYAIYMALNSFPAIFAPIIGGAILDRLSRKKTIYTLDFISSGLFLIIAIITFKGWFNFGILAVYTFIVGTINGVYQVAYESLYPMLVSEGNFTKAYSVSAFLETIAAVMLPISTLLYNLIGIAPLLLVNSITFFIAACVETRIEKDEGYIVKQKKAIEGKRIGKLGLLFSDLREGANYLAAEKGLLFVAIYFGFSALQGGVSQVLVLPYFKGNFENGEYIYVALMVASIIARTLGGGIHYKFKLPTDKKFTIAFIVYLSIAIIDGTYLYLSFPLMMILMIVQGFMGITSYTIRVSATQSYVPDEKKGRFNGVFIMINQIGILLGELLSGALTEILPIRGVVSGFACLTAIASIVLIGMRKEHIAPIYNRQE